MRDGEDAETETAKADQSADRAVPPDRPGAEGFPSRADSRAAARAVNTGSTRSRASEIEVLHNEEQDGEGTTEQPENNGLEGKRDYIVDDPTDPGRTITDIDRIESDTLWEEKSATSASDIDKWVTKHIDKKFQSYLDARQHMPGYEQAPIGFRFTEPVTDPEFQSAVEAAVDGLRTSHPNVAIYLEWSS
jgi:hypothetical protein